MDKQITSSLILNKLVFDKIEFVRENFRNNESKFEFKLGVNIGYIDNKGNSEEGIYKITLTLTGRKEKEYHIEIVLTGFFKFDETDNIIPEEVKNDVISKNTVAIMMPYLRSQVSLLTAQPDVDSVVLPPFNINKMMNNE